MAKQRNNCTTLPVAAGDERVAQQGGCGSATRASDFEGYDELVVDLHDDATELHDLAWELYVASVPSHRCSGISHAQLARDCYEHARAFIKVRREQLNRENAEESTP